MQLVKSNNPNHYHILDTIESGLCETMCGFGGGSGKQTTILARELLPSSWVEAGNKLCDMCLFACADEADYYRKNFLLKRVVNVVRFLSRRGIINSTD